MDRSPSSAGVDLRLLEPFVVLADELHFTRAAERLHVAQPALSQQISRLEHQLGGRLFHRSSQGVALTSLGAELLERLRPSLVDVGAALDHARATAAGRQGPLRVGFLSSLAAPVLPLVAAALRDAEPGIELHLTEATLAVQLTELHAGRLDLALFSRFDGLILDDTGLRIDVLARGPQYLALPATHRLAGAQSIAFADVAGEPLVLPSGGDDTGYRGAVLAAARLRGVEPNPGPQANNVATMLGLVAGGFGVAMVAWPSALVPRTDVVFVLLAGEHVDIVAASTDRRPAAAEPFVAAARTVIEDLVPRA